MIGTQQEGVAVHLIKGKISREWVIDFTRLHEQWNYDSVLVGYYASAAEGFAIALYAADHTERHQIPDCASPGSVAPALAARQIATFDQLTQGRMALHVIRRHQRRGPGQRGRLPAQERPLSSRRRISRCHARIWTSDCAVRPQGRVLSDRRRLFRHQAASAALSETFLRRLSEGALEMGAAHCDVFRDLRRAAGRDARPQSTISAAAPRRSDAGPDFNMSLRPIMADTEGAAWDKAHALLADVERKTGEAPQPTNHSSERLLGYAAACRRA
jgi:alkanesulfonate monooxygenase